MSSPSILITHWVHDEVLDYLGRYGKLITNQTQQSLEKSVLSQHARKADAIMAFMPDSFDDEFLSHCEQLKIVGAALKGYDNFDVEACTKRGIWFSIVPDHLTIPTAELAIGHLIAIGRNMATGDRRIRNGLFPGWRPTLYGRGLAGSTVGILGMGEVGQSIAKMLTSFSCSCLYHDIYKLEEDRQRGLQTHYASLDQLYAESDFVVAALPLNDGTFNFIDKKALNLMKKGAYLVNIGRGSCVDERAVAKALAHGQLSGYAADVFAFEDWARSERSTNIPAELLGQYDQTFFTPHLGSAVDGVRKDIAMDAAINIVEALQGKRPHGAINQIQ